MTVIYDEDDCPECKSQMSVIKELEGDRLNYYFHCEHCGFQETCEWEESK